MIINYIVCCAGPSRVSTLKASERHHVRYGDRKWRKMEEAKFGFGSRRSVSQFPSSQVWFGEDVDFKLCKGASVIWAWPDSGRRVRASESASESQKKKFTVGLLAYTVAAGTLQDHSNRNTRTHVLVASDSEFPPRILYLLFFFLVVRRKDVYGAAPVKPGLNIEVGQHPSRASGSIQLSRPQRSIQVHVHLEHITIIVIAHCSSTIFLFRTKKKRTSPLSHAFLQNKRGSRVKK